MPINVTRDDPNWPPVWVHLTSDVTAKQLVRWVATEKDLGTEAIGLRLESGGMDPGEARRIVAAQIDQVEMQQPPAPPEVP